MFGDFNDGFDEEPAVDDEIPFDAGGEELTGPPRSLDFEPHREPHRAMILDDNPEVARQLKVVAERLLTGWVLELFTDLPQAIQALIHGRFDALLTDFNLKKGETSEPLIRVALDHGISSSHMVVWTGNALDAQGVMPASVSVYQKPDVEALKNALVTIRQLVEGRIGEA